MPSKGLLLNPDVLAGGVSDLGRGEPWGEGLGAGVAAGAGAAVGAGAAGPVPSGEAGGPAGRVDDGIPAV